MSTMQLFETLVPPLDLCRKIPAGDFAKTCFVWLDDNTPVVKSPSGREYKLWALNALVLALRTAWIERDKCGVMTKRRSPYHAGKRSWNK